MAICLMYLTDTETAVEQATNASLTRLLRLQTQLATGNFFLLMISILFIVDVFEGAFENLNDEINPFEDETSAGGDAIQVSTSISLRAVIFIFKKIIYQQYSNSIECAKMNGQVPFFSVCYFTLINCFCFDGVHLP